MAHQPQPQPQSQTQHTLCGILLEFLHTNTQDGASSRWQMPPRPTATPTPSTGHAQVPTQEFIQSTHLIGVLHRNLYDAMRQSNIPLLGTYIRSTARCLATAIYEANDAENAGLDAEQTRELCYSIFSGQEVDGRAVVSDPWAYRRAKWFLRSRRRIERPGVQDVLRAVGKVIRYAKAYLFLIDAFLSRKRPLRGEVLLQAWRILSADGSLSPRALTPTGLDAGGYIAVYLGDGFTMISAQWTFEARLARSMNRFAIDLQCPMIDPFFLGAEMCSAFVAMNSFFSLDDDGCGRMGRMILNVVLMRYFGVVITVGETVKESEVYGRLMREPRICRLQETGNEELAGFVVEQVWESLRALMRELPVGAN